MLARSCAGAERSPRGVTDERNQVRQHLPGLRHAEREEGQVDVGADGVRPVIESGHDSKVPATAPQGPEQVGMLLPAHREQLAVRGHHFESTDVVAAQAVLAPHPAVAAGEGQTGDTGLRDQAQRDGKTVRLGRPIDITDQRATGRTHPPRRAVNGDIAEPAQVDHQSVVDHRGAGHVMPAATHRDSQVMIAGIPHGLRDISSASAVHNQLGTLVDGAVPDAPRLVVGGVHGADDRTANRTSEPRECLGSHFAILGSGVLHLICATVRRTTSTAPASAHRNALRCRGVRARQRALNG